MPRVAGAAGSELREGFVRASEGKQRNVVGVLEITRSPQRAPLVALQVLLGTQWLAARQWRELVTSLP
jgi:hypothetical protein